MEYPRTIVVTDEKLVKMVKEKDDLITEGRKIYEEVAVLIEEMDAIDKEIQAVEATVDMSDITAKAEELTAQVNALREQMNQVNKEGWDRLKSKVPAELGDKYETKKKQKEELENQVKKIALKVEQKKDKIIPRTRKFMSQFIEDEFEDYDSIRQENGQVVATLFNHLEDFKKSYREKKK